MVQCKDKDAQNKFACRFYGDIENNGAYGVTSGADDSNWSAIGDAGSADITTWQRYPESFFQTYDNDLGVCRHKKAGTETQAKSDKCYAKRKPAGQNGQHSTSTYAAVVSSCTNDADCEWVAPWTYNPYETYQVADAATFTVRRHRALLAGSRAAKAGADTAEKCAKECLTQVEGCGAFDFDTVAATCHTTGLNVQETTSSTLTNTHNVDYYELLIYKQPVRGDRLFCTHDGANGNEWDTKVVATCRSYTTEDAARVTTTDMANCVSGNGCQFNDELTYWVKEDRPNTDLIVALSSTAATDAAATWSLRQHHKADTVTNAGWTSTPPSAARTAASLGACAVQCLKASFDQQGCHSFDWDSNAAPAAAC
jgi:hypothetical protein